MWGQSTTYANLIYLFGSAESVNNVNNNFLFFLIYLFPQQGHFRTSSGSFFIEPIEDYADENKNILHLLYRAPQTKSHDELDTENDDLPNASVGEWFKEFFI